MGIRQATFNDYAGFVEKFKPKKTTDDCYTPKEIYEVVLNWAAREYGFDPSKAVRPFWPGADYEAESFAPDAVVVDNPPFSMIAKIVRNFNARRVRYFLFSPYLTNLGLRDCNHVITGESITYENGAKVDTAFVTNMGEWFITSAPDLARQIRETNARLVRAKSKALPKYEYPSEVVTSAKVGYLAKHGMLWRVRKSACHFIRKLDNQEGTGIFGSGYLLGTAAAAEKAAATRYQLSERERGVIRLIDARVAREVSGE